MCLERAYVMTPRPRPTILFFPHIFFSVFRGTSVAREEQRLRIESLLFLRGVYTLRVTNYADNDCSAEKEEHSRYERDPVALRVRLSGRFRPFYFLILRHGYFGLDPAIPLF